MHPGLLKSVLPYSILGDAVVEIKGLSLGCKPEGLGFCLRHIWPPVCSLQSLRLPGDEHLCHRLAALPLRGVSTREVPLHPSYLPLTSSGPWTSCFVLAPQFLSL